MLVKKFPLFIPIVSNADTMSINSNPSYDYMEDEDILMTMEELTPVSTPVEQLTCKDYGFPAPPPCGRTVSTSSIASSISNISLHNDFSYSSFASHYKLTEPFEKLLMQTYQDYQTDPTITPFNELNPPSGILAKVSKDALAKAMENGIEVGIEINNYSLTIIRQKLIQICRANSVAANNLSQMNSRNSSFSALNTINNNNNNNNNNNTNNNNHNYPALNLAAKLKSLPSTASNLQNQVVFDFRDPNDGYFSFESPPSPPAQNCYFPQSLQSLQAHAAGLQPSFLQEAAQINAARPSTSVMDSNTNIPDSSFNATSNRKRESLRLKRSGTKPTYN